MPRPSLGDGTGAPVPLTAVEVTPHGTSYGTPSGTATISYDPAAKTLKVTVTASGLAPGRTPRTSTSEAAQARAGAVHADGLHRQQRRPDHERDPDAQPRDYAAPGWYLNLHQGNSNTIAQNGQPTIFFRPLLCADI